MPSPKQTYCLHGHEFNEENTYTGSTGTRRCRTCDRNRGKEKRKENPEKYNVKSSNWRKENPQRAKKVSREFQLRKAGFTTESFEKKFKAQNRTCEICNRLLEVGVGAKVNAACADHEHTEPPKPRGILCSPCNQGIGSLQDSPELLRKAALYIESYTSTKGGYMSVLTQDVFGVPSGVVGQKVLVRGSVTGISGSGATAQLTVTPFTSGSLGDLNTTVVVGPKQVSSPSHPTGTLQVVFGTYLDVVGRTVMVRGTITGISGTGATAQITVAVDNNSNLGDLSNSVTVGPKQLSSVTVQ